jgi:hypothetical protein
VRWDDVGTIPFDALGAPGWKSRGGAGATTTSAMPAQSSPQPPALPEGRQHAG